MICGHSIRSLTPKERAERQARHIARYERIYEEVEADMLAEFEINFGPTYRVKHPYTPSHDEIDTRTLRRIANEFEHD